MTVAHTVVPPVKAKTHSSVCSSGHGQNLTSNNVDAGLMSIHTLQERWSRFDLTSNFVGRLGEM
jgi:hypothetical protein